DVVINSQSGTGKTATYMIATQQLIDSNKLQILIITPRRELASDIALVYKQIANYMDIKVAKITGETLDETNIHGANVIVGTPNFTLNFIKRKILDLDFLKTVVIEEADELFNIGYIDTMEQLLLYLPKNCSLNLFA